MPLQVVPSSNITWTKTLSWHNIDICCAENSLEGGIGLKNYEKELSL